MKTIGGYFELECGHAPLYHQDGIYLNLCRSALRYLIRALGIKQIHVPVYTCHVVYDAIRQEGCRINSYRLAEDLMPASDFPEDDYIIYNNYFGTLGRNVEMLAKVYPNLIVDNAQAFYSRPNCRAAIYSPRKFFGLPDSGILIGEDIPLLNLPQGHSVYVSSHLLQRHDFGAEWGYPAFVQNENILEEYPLETISPLTLALMGNIDYDRVRRKRLANFRYLHERLHSAFPFALSEDDVPMVYPLYLENGANVRARLIENKIFVARYWPNVLEWCSPVDLEYRATERFVAIPLDQRYGIEDMNIILEIIKHECFN